MNEQEASVVCVLFLDDCVIDQVLCVSVVLSMTVSDIQSETEAVIKTVSLRPIHCHSFIGASTQSKHFLSFLPPLKPSRSKSVKLEVDEDKSTKGSNFPPSEVTIGLSPYTFPQEWPFHVPGRENIDWRVSAWQNHYTPISSAATEVRALQ